MEKREKYFFITLFILVFVIYGQSLFGGFVFDDRGIIEHAELLSNPTNIKEVALYPYWDADAGLYRPATLLSYAFNIIFLGGSAFSFHFINLLLYFGICAAIYLLIKKLFNRKLAFITALLFLVLPIHTEVVANITGRSELLALLFSLLTLLEFSEGKINWWRAGLWTFLAIGAKETAIALVPLVGFLILIKEKGLNREILEKYFRGVSAAVIGATLYLFIRFFALGPEHFLGVQTSLIENPLLFASPLERIATAAGVLWMYVGKAIYPANLCSDYSYDQIPVVSGFSEPATIFGLLIFAFACASIFLWKRKPIIAFAGAFFSVSFLLVSNFLFPIGTIAGERLFFYSSVGFVLFFAFLLTKLPRRILPFVPLVIVVIYGSISFQREALWTSEYKLFLNAAECSPNSVLSLSNAGAAHYLEGNLTQAQKYLERSREIKPIYSKGLNNLGLVYWKQGRLDDAEALYHESLKQKYPYPGAIENLILLNISERDEAGTLRWLRIMYPNVDDSVLRNLF